MSIPGQATASEVGPSTADQDLLIEQGRMLSEAVLGLASGADLPTLLRDLVQAAMRLTGARYGALGVLDEDGRHLTEFIAEGMSEAEQARIGAPPEGRGVLGELILRPRPLRLRDVAEHPDSVGFPSGHPVITSFLGVPVRVGSQVFGNLYLGTKTPDPDGQGFTGQDEQLLIALSAAAGLAVQSTRLSESAGRLARLTERQRIAADLHDGVIQRLFATGLSLQSAEPLAERAPDPELRRRISQAVEDIDDTIAQLRTTIHGLEEDDRAGRSALRLCIAETVEQETDSAGVRPLLDVRGPLDALLSAEQADHLLHALREALSNVVRHAQAHQVRVVVSTVPGYLTLTVTDDGRGMSRATDPGRGLANLERRARSQGGTCTVTSPPAARAHGTEVRWQIPLRQ